MIDMELDVNDELLAIEYFYPSEQDLNSLPKVWLRSNAKITRYPSSLDFDENLTIILHWDDLSDFTVGLDLTSQDYEDINIFDNYIIQRQQAVRFTVQALVFIW